MPKSILLLAMFAAFGAFAAGREAFMSVDLARLNQQDMALSWTENIDTAIRLSVRRNGDDYCVTNMMVNFVLGDGTRGCVYEGVATGWSDITFDIPAYSIPTNGRYNAQIISMLPNGRSEEWMRGTVRVNLNHGMEYMPTCWMGYQKVAALAAMYVSWSNLVQSATVYAQFTNSIREAVTEAVGNLESEHVSSRTNLCLRVIKSNLGIVPWSAFVPAEEDSGIVKWENADYPGVYMRSLGTDTNGVFDVKVLVEGSVRTLLPTNINGDTFFIGNATNVNERYIRVYGDMATDRVRDAALGR